jgi:hypothetical protein
MTVVLGVVAAGLMAGPGGGAVAQPAGGDPVVTVEAGPTRPASFSQPCNDVVLGFDEATSFVLRRSPASANPLSVSYRLGVAPQHDQALEPVPGTATFAAGLDTATVTVTPGTTREGALVEVTLELAAGPGYRVGTPASATIRFVSPRFPGPVECGYRFTADPWNAGQTVALGEPLHALTLEQFVPPGLLPAPGVFRVVAGILPAGVTLAADGSFAGVPAAPGVSTARIEACRPAPPGTCVTTDLSVTVVGGGATTTTLDEPLARTGGPFPLAGLLTAAAAFAAAGSLALALARARAGPRPGAR